VSLVQPVYKFSYIHQGTVRFGFVVTGRCVLKRIGNPLRAPRVADQIMILSGNQIHKVADVLAGGGFRYKNAVDIAYLSTCCVDNQAR
jgi:hypothetical protein